MVCTEILAKGPCLYIEPKTASEASLERNFRTMLRCLQFEICRKSCRPEMAEIGVERAEIGVERAEIPGIRFSHILIHP